MEELDLDSVYACTDVEEVQPPPFSRQSCVSLKELVRTEALIFTSTGIEFEITSLYVAGSTR